MEIILLFLVLIVLFVVGGLGGWLLRAIFEIFSFLGDGCSNGIGCLLFIVFVILCLLMLGAAIVGG
jgi:hypothetical protein